MDDKNTSSPQRPGGPRPAGRGRPPGQFRGRGGPRRAYRPLKDIDFRNAGSLSVFLREDGKILSRNITRLHPKDQRKLTRAIKRARYMGLLG